MATFQQAQSTSPERRGSIRRAFGSIFGKGSSNSTREEKERRPSKLSIPTRPGIGLERKNSSFSSKSGSKHAIASSSSTSTAPPVQAPAEGGSSVPDSIEAVASQDNVRHQSTYRSELTRTDKIEDSMTTRMSLNLPPMLLNSSSPASELPKNWKEWQHAYKMGLIGKPPFFGLLRNSSEHLGSTWSRKLLTHSDFPRLSPTLDFNDPPAPPDPLWSSPPEYSTRTGIHQAPTPIHESSRQRAVDNLGLLPSNRIHRPSTTSDDTTFGTDIHPGEEEEDEAQDFLNPKELSIHPKLQSLIEEANLHFDTNAGNVSLISQDKIVYFAEKGFGGADELERKELVCDHTIAKASADDEIRDQYDCEDERVDEGFVVMDLGKDWRFTKNDFGPYSAGFYAGVPIRLPSALGDSYPTRPCGVFCVLSDQPRTKPFTKQDHEVLNRFAKEAGKEILKVSEERKERRGRRLEKKYQEWRINSGVLSRRGSENKSIGFGDDGSVLEDFDGVDDQEELKSALEDEDDELDRRIERQMNLGQDDDDHHDFISNMGFSNQRGARSGSTLDEVSIKALADDATPPVFSRRLGKTFEGGKSATMMRVREDQKGVFDLSTKLICESLDLDFAYLLSVSSPSEALSIVSSHNLPIPSPLFHLTSHLSATTTSAVLYHHASTPPIEEGQISSGLIVKLPVATGWNESEEEINYYLGCFSEDRRRLIGLQDLAFVRSTLGTLGKACERL